MPLDILIIVLDEMNDNIFPVALANKKIYNLTENRRVQELKKYLLMKAFYNRCDPLHGVSFFRNASTQRECWYVLEYFKKRYDYTKPYFIKRVRFLLEHASIPDLIWNDYIREYNQESDLTID